MEGNSTLTITHHQNRQTHLQRSIIRKAGGFSKAAKPIGGMLGVKSVPIEFSIKGKRQIA